MRPSRTVLAMAMLAGALLQHAEAQEAAEKKVEWKLSGEVRVRPEWRNNQDLNSEVDDQTSEVFMRFRLGVEATIKKDFRVFIQAQDSRVWGEEASTTSDEQNLDLHQGYLEVVDLGVKGLSFAVGRQEWIYGDQRLIGNLNWSNVGRSFDGARVRWQLEKFTADLLWAEIANRLEAGATTGADLYGVYTQSRPRAGAEYEGYLLGYANRFEAPGESGMPGSTQVYGLGARARDRFGGFDFTVEAAVERGDFNGDELRAGAFGAIFGWTWGSATRTRIFGGYDYATGDRDITDGEQNQFFNFFPTNHPLYGYMDYEGWRNIKSPYAGVSLTHGRHFYQIKGHHFDLQSASGPWQDSGGAILGFDPAGNSGTDMGDEVDLTYRFDWREKAVVEVGLSRFWPGQFAENTRGVDSSDWGYVQLTWGF